MPLLAPLALLGLLFIPLIVAFYMLRLRRTERVVSSTFLWRELVRDVEANVPWQRLRRSLLLLLQLLLVAALVLAVARPFNERTAAFARNLVIVIDATASMAARDVHPDRLTAAKRAAIDALRDVPADARVSVVAAGNGSRVVANEMTDKGRVARAIEGIELSSVGDDLTEALRLADALAVRAHGAEVLVVTDDAGGQAGGRGEATPSASVRASAEPGVSRPPGASGEPRASPGSGADPSHPRPFRLSVPVRVLTVGRARDNQAIAALAVRADPSGLKRSVFVSVANLSDERVTRRLQILADGAAVTARDVPLEPLTRAEVVIDELPPGTRLVEARLGAAGDTGGGADAGRQADQLAVDDIAWAAVPPDRLRRILLVGPGNVYLQNALTLLPNVELYGAQPDEYERTTGKELFDLVVFDGWLPPALPEKPILAIAPPASSALGEVKGTVRAPAIGQPATDEPLLRNVDLSRLHIAETQRIVPPPWARTVLPGPPDAPLLFAGSRDGFATAVLAFDLRKSDLPLEVAWPILAANLTGELLGTASAMRESIRPGSPVELALPPDATGMRITRPDGSVDEAVPATALARSVTFVATTEVGPYRAEPIAAEEVATPAASATKPSPSGAASPSASAAPSAAGSASAPAVDPGDDGSVLFAVNLFDLGESNIAPGSGARLAALGTPRAAGATEPGQSRDEWWVPIALLVLVMRVAEWLVSERDGARRLATGARGAISSLAPRRRRT